MADQKIPIEHIKRASILTCFFLHRVLARFAVIRHAVDIGPARHIGLRGDDAAIRELAHPDGIGRFDPFKRIGVDFQIPLMHLLGIDAGEQRKIAGHHEALNVMRIGLLAGLLHRFGQTMHLCFTAPIERRQIAFML